MGRERRKVVQLPEDMGIDVGQANTSLLAARSMDDLVAWSGGPYKVPEQFR